MRAHQHAAATGPRSAKSRPEQAFRSPPVGLALTAVFRLQLLLAEALCRPDMPRRSIAAGTLLRLPRMLPPALLSAPRPSLRLLLRMTPPPKGSRDAAEAAALAGLSGTGRFAIACTMIRLARLVATSSSQLSIVWDTEPVAPPSMGACIAQAPADLRQVFCVLQFFPGLNTEHEDVLRLAGQYSGPCKDCSSQHSEWPAVQTSL